MTGYPIVTGPVLTSRSLRIIRPKATRHSTAARVRPSATPAERTVYIASDTGRKLALRYAPVEVTHDGMTPTWTATARVGRKPLNQRQDDGLRTMSFDVFIGSPNWTESHEHDLAMLRVMAQEGDRISVSLSALERGLWRLTGLTFNTSQRQPGTKITTQATASLSFTEVSDLTVKAGITSGGAKKPPSKPHAKAGHHPKAKPRARTVAYGDTVWSIAAQELGDASRGGDIARASGLRDVRALVVGSVLTIPAS